MIIAGNWKMQKTGGEARAFVGDLLDGAREVSPAMHLRIYPSFVALESVARLARGTRIQVGAQNLHPERAGAFTGEISASMILDAGVESVLIGHSERRHIFGESDEFLGRKVAAALAAGLRPLFCIGENLEDRESGRTDAVLEGQIQGALRSLDSAAGARLEIAYEPVWAIGTGRVAETAQVAGAHAAIRDLLGALWGDVGRRIPILYGGSVNPANAGELVSLPGVDGVLVGGASLDVESFLGIARAAQKCA